MSRGSGRIIAPRIHISRAAKRAQDVIRAEPRATGTVELFAHPAARFRGVADRPAANRGSDGRVGPGPPSRDLRGPISYMRGTRHLTKLRSYAAAFRRLRLTCPYERVIDGFGRDQIHAFVHGAVAPQTQVVTDDWLPTTASPVSGTAGTASELRSVGVAAWTSPARCAARRSWRHLIGVFEPPHSDLLRIAT
jgi:hypothetical protein